MTSATALQDFAKESNTSACLHVEPRRKCCGEGGEGEEDEDGFHGVFFWPINSWIPS